MEVVCPIHLVDLDYYPLLPEKHQSWPLKGEASPKASNSSSGSHCSYVTLFKEQETTNLLQIKRTNDERKVCESSGHEAWEEIRKVCPEMMGEYFGQRSCGRDKIPDSRLSSILVREMTYTASVFLRLKPTDFTSFG